MADHGTALSIGQLADFLSTGTKALTLLADQLGPDLAHKWAGKSELMQERILRVLREPMQIRHYADGVAFSLTLDGDAVENQPLEMVQSDRYAGTWQHNGPTVKGRQTRTFKWVSVGYCDNFQELVAKLKKHGDIQEGQWREAVKATFEPDGEHPRGIADPSWVGPRGRAHFPSVLAYGRSYFYWAERDFGDVWRWLVAVSK